MIQSELFGTSAPQRDRVGVELELIPLQPMPFREPRQVPLDAASGASITRLFENLVGQPGWEAMGGTVSPVIARTSGGNITLEPAGQVEYSGPVFMSPSAALADLESAADALAVAGEGLGLQWLARGYNNVCSERVIELQMRKPRYLAMDAHFSAIGPFGRRMMRATAALQLNLDFGIGETVAQRWRLANMIAPSMNALFANSPHVHGNRFYRSFRYEIWRHADPSRTGRLFDSPDLDPVADYLRFALDATVMMVRDASGIERVPSERMTFGSWMDGSAEHGYPDWEDWALHLSTLFPDVRAKGWLEIRSIDALPRPWWGVPIAVVTALLYDPGVRRAALARLEERPRHRTSDCIGPIGRGGKLTTAATRRPISSSRA